VALSTKLTKEDLKNPDLMTQELRAGFSWSVNHSKTVFGIIGVFIVGGLIYSAVGYFSNKSENQIQEKFYQVEREYLTKKEKFEAAEKPETQAPPAADKNAKNKKTEKETAKVDKTADKSTGDIEKDYGSSVKGFQQVVNQAPDSRAARMSALMLSEIYEKYNQKAKGLEILQKVQTSSDLLSGLIQDRVAGFQADQGDCKSAIGTWDKILSHKEFSFMVAEVKLKKGLCFETLKDFTQAQAMYTQAKESGEANSAVAKRAEKYLRLLPTGQLTAQPTESKN
jgi:tetratricopeptide (TPR) repeat protein